MEENKKPTVAVAMIVKNEMEHLERCLESVKDADAIYIADTGSTDNGETVYIARKYTDNVYTDYKWEDSFAKARNYIKSKVKEDFIFSLDADEFCHDFSKVREAVEEADKLGVNGINIKQYSESDKQLNYFPRVFRNIPEVKWEGVAHNWPTVNGADIGNIEITYGYSLAHYADPNRTLRILEKAHKSGEAGAREMYYLGREYWYRQMYKDCTKILGEYVQKTNFLAEKADAFLMMGRCYWAQKLPDDARDACVQALIINPHFLEAILFMAEITGRGTGNEKWEKNAEQWMRMAETADNSNVLFVRSTREIKNE